MIIFGSSDGRIGCGVDDGVAVGGEELGGG